MPQKVSLYIPCYNAQGYIDKTLQGILRQTYPVDEILIIDDGPTQETAEIASRYPITLFPRKGKSGLPSARNLAMRTARNEFVAALDADCVPEPEWLEKLMRNFDREDIAAAGGKAIEKYTLTLADKWRAIHMHQHWGDALVINPPCVYGANGVYRKSAVAAAGFFDEEKCNRSYEDVDMSRRLKAAGYRIIYDPQALVYHIRQDTLPSLLRTNWNWSFLGMEGRRIPDNLYNVGCKAYDSLFLLCQRLGEDIRKMRFNLLALDLMVYFYNRFSDLKYYISLKCRKRH